MESLVRMEQTRTTTEVDLYCTPDLIWQSICVSADSGFNTKHGSGLSASCHNLWSHFVLGVCEVTPLQIELSSNLIAKYSF